MKTLYIDINNQPIQETDEVNLFSDNGKLQNAFFYELGSYLLSKSGINVPKAQLISEFGNSGNKDAYDKIVSQWNVLKAILFGEDIEGAFNVSLPKEYILWLSRHQNQDYRDICRNKKYDCTKDLVITIDVEDFYDEYVIDDFKRSLIKVLRDNVDIEQFVFNNNAVTRKSIIVKSLRKEFETLLFIPFEKWEEKHEDTEAYYVEESLLKYPFEKREIIYSEISSFENGLAKVKANVYRDSICCFYRDDSNYNRQLKENNELLKSRPFGVDKYGFINEEGVEIIPCVFDEITEVSSDRIYAFINNVEFILNRRGEVISLSNDHNDRKIQTEEAINFNGKDYILFSKSLRTNKYGVKDKHGRIIVPCCFEHIDFVDSDHFLVYVDDYLSSPYILNRNKKLLNRLPFSYEPYRFSEGLSVVQQNRPGERNNYNYINIKGHVVIKGGWRQASSFNNGIATVRQHGSSKQPYYEIDKTGKALKSNERYGIY